MKLYQYLIWLALFLPLYGLANFYILRRALQAFSLEGRRRRAFIVFFVLCASTYWISRAIESFRICALSGALFWAGSFWFAVMAYLGLAALLADALRGINRLFSWFPRIVTDNYRAVKALYAIAAAAVTAALIVWGRINSMSPVLTRLDVEIPKKRPQGSTLDMALVTDIHLGTIVRNGDVKRMAALVESIGPDLVILGGDVLDEDVGPVLRYGIGEDLRAITSRYPTFAVPGNHEYYGGIDEATKYLEEHGVTVLADRVIDFEGVSFAGRDDRTRDQIGPSQRRPLRALFGDVVRDRPVVLLSHQPRDIDEAAAAGADLMLSGHTHHGQIWPFIHVTDLVYEVSSGTASKGGMKIYVSTGFGTWGPPVRIGTRPEVVHIRLRFTGR